MNQLNMHVSEKMGMEKEKKKQDQEYQKGLRKYTCMHN